jgi:hypothetical protein
MRFRIGSKALMVVSAPWRQGTPRQRRHGARNGPGGSADGQARGQHGGLVVADLAPLQPSLDVLKLDPVQVTQEQDVDGVAPDVGLQAPRGLELRRGSSEVTGRLDRGSEVLRDPPLIDSGWHEGPHS